VTALSGQLLGPLLNIFLIRFISMCVRCYPLKDKWRVSLKCLIAVYMLVFILQGAALISFHEYFAVDYVGSQWLMLFFSSITILLPFFLIKGAFFENLFLTAINAGYVTVVFGAGNYVELSFGGVIAERYPYLICNIVIVSLSAFLLPLLLRVLRRMFGLMREGKPPIWKFIWAIPAVFFALSMMTGNILMGEHVITAAFMTVRLFLGSVMVVTCFLFVKVLHQEVRNAELAEHARMMESQLDLQRVQYERLTENAEHEKAVRHDIRHQLAVLKGFGAAGDLDNLNRYLNELTGSLLAPERLYCKNHAVNAVINHYLSAVESGQTWLDIKLDIPERTGGVPDMDLCVVIGNMLENAVEACRRMEHGEKFIRARTLVQGVYLTLVVENSFDGLWYGQGGVYLSRKREGAGRREGVGLSSVKAVCAKYGGRAVFEVNGNVWRSSAVMHMWSKEHVKNCS